HNHLCDSQLFFDAGYVDGVVGEHLLDGIELGFDPAQTCICIVQSLMHVVQTLVVVDYGDDSNKCGGACAGDGCSEVAVHLTCLHCKRSEGITFIACEVDDQQFRSAACKDLNRSKGAFPK